MVLDLSQLAYGWEGFLKMALPPRRVLSVTIPAHFCELQHSLNATTQAACCLGLFAPDRIEHLNHESRIDRRDRKIAEHGICISPQGRLPLGGVLSICPGGAVIFDIGSGTLGKCDHPGGVQPRSGLPLTLRVDWVDASAPKPTSFTRALAGLRQRHITDRPQTHLAAPALGLVAEKPNFAPAIGDAQDQTASVAVIAGLFNLLHRSRGQSIVLSRSHRFLPITGSRN